MLSRSFVVVSLASLVALCSCKNGGGDGGKSSSAPSGSSSSGSKSSKEAKTGSSETLDPGHPLAVTMNDKSVKFVSAIADAYFDGSLEIVVSASKDQKCGSTPEDAESMTLHVSKSPDGKWWPNQVITVPLSLRSKDPAIGIGFSAVASPFARAKLSPVDTKSEKFALTLEIDQTKKVLNPKEKLVTVKGDGTVEVKTCFDDDTAKTLKNAPTPDLTSVKGPISGTADGKKFEAKSALAWIRDDADAKRKYVSAIEFYDNANATCEMGATSFFSGGGVPGTQFSIVDTGITDKRQLVDVPQPIVITGGTVGTGSFTGSQYTGAGAVVFEKIEMKEGGTIAGTLSTDSGPRTNTDEQGKLAGTFKAKVCKRDW